jgi:rRNA maturation RNase YbeY
VDGFRKSGRPDRFSLLLAFTYSLSERNIMKLSQQIEIMNLSRNWVPKAKLVTLFPFLKRELKKLGKSNSDLAHRLEAWPEGTLTCVFLSSRQMKKINFQFRKKNKVTDVLSFESPYGPGELLFCLDQIKRQAKDQKHSVSAELSYMLIHGVLHLLGYDHEKSRSQAEKMFEIQDHIFKKWVNL